MEKERGEHSLVKRKCIPKVVGESTGTCLKNIMLGEGHVLVLDKEGDGSDVYLFRYPIVMKSVWWECCGRSQECSQVLSRHT